jgi:DNA-binding transcriptional LysR family regulator
LELSNLIAFFHVARLGSVSKASEIVCRSQPAVSQQIKALEEELGCHLFHRIGKRKLVLTEEGKRLQQFAQNTLSEMDRTLEDIHALVGSNRG